MDKAKTTDFDIDFIEDPPLLAPGSRGGEIPKIGSVAPAIESVPGVAPGPTTVSLPFTLDEFKKKLGAPKVEVGDIVLFRISSDTESLALRPVLVGCVGPGGNIGGNLFLNVTTDWACEWVRQNLFVQLAEANRIVPLMGAEPGAEMGNWRPK